MRGVGLAAPGAGLGQASAEHVADGEQSDVPPGPIGGEDVPAVIGYAVTDDLRDDQYTDDRRDVDDSSVIFHDGFVSSPCGRPWWPPS